MELTINKRHVLYVFIKELAVIHGIRMSELSKRCITTSAHVFRDRTYLHESIIYGTLDTVTKVVSLVSNVLHTNTPVKFFYNILNDNHVKPWKELMTQRKRIDIKYYQVINKRNKQKYNYIGIIRRYKGISTDYFAKKLGVGDSDINVIETCKHPNIATVIKVAPILGLSVYALGKRFNYTDEQITNTRMVTSTDNICHYLYTLRQQHGYTQGELANLLCTAQTNISTMESLRPPTLINLMKLAKIYDIPVLTLLHKHPKYKDIENNSPSYKIIKLCIKEHLSPNQLSEEINDTNGSVFYTIRKLKHNNDHIDITIAHELIDLFHLPKGYFGKSIDRRFFTSFNRFKYNNPKLTELDFGYRLSKMRDKYHLTLKDIGDKLEVSKERVRQLEHTRSLNINYDTLKGILKIFPNNERKYLKGDYHYLHDIFSNTEQNLINGGIKKLIYDSKFNVGNFFKYLHQTLHISDKNIANMLNGCFNKFFYSGVRPYDIYYTKSIGHPRVPLAMKLADFCSIPLIELLKKCLKYRNLERYSPAYKIFRLSFYNNLPTVTKLSKFTKIPPHEIKNVYLHAQLDGDTTL